MSGVPATSPVSPTSHPTLLSIWRSPVAYLFGGMAAVSMLISSALLLLILSYWQNKNRLNRVEEEYEQRSRDLESAAAEDEMMNFNRRIEGSVKTTTTAYGEKFAVIMAGDEMPRCLASPRCYRGFGLEGEEGEEEEERSVIAGKPKRSTETTSCDVVVSPARRV